MARLRSGHDLADMLAAVVIEFHVKKLRAHARGLSLRALPASEQPTDTAETRCSERRPPEQTGAKNADRDRHREFALQPGERGDRERNDPTADLDTEREHDRIGRQ